MTCSISVAGITFNNRCIIDVDSLDFRMLPTTDDAYDFYIGDFGANRWKSFRAYASGAAELVSTGSSVAITAANDVNIFASDAVFLRNVRLGFFNGSIAAKQTVTFAASKPCPAILAGAGQVLVDNIIDDIAALKAAFVAYSLIA